MMRDGFRNGKVPKMNYSLGNPKGMRVVLEERGIDKHQMVADHMREKFYAITQTSRMRNLSSWWRKEGT